MNTNIFTTKDMVENNLSSMISTSNLSIGDTKEANTLNWGTDFGVSLEEPPIDQLMNSIGLEIQRQGG